MVVLGSHYFLPSSMNWPPLQGFRKPLPSHLSTCPSGKLIQLNQNDRHQDSKHSKDVKMPWASGS